MSALTTVTLYETTSETQKDTFKEIFKTSKSFYKKTPGFSGFMGLASGDGLRVIEFTQWQDEPSYEAFPGCANSESSYDYSKYYEKYTQTQSDESASAAPFTGKFVVEQVVAPPGLMAAIPGESALVQISRFSPLEQDRSGIGRGRDSTNPGQPAPVISGSPQCHSVGGH
jgi:heme-degrading monooxygenase HmoA